MTHEFQENLYPTLPTWQYELLVEVVSGEDAALGQALAIQSQGAERLQVVRLWGEMRDEVLGILQRAQMAAQNAGNKGRADDLDDIQTILRRSVWVQAALDGEVRGRQLDKARAMAQGAFREDGDVLGMHLKQVSTPNGNGGATLLVREPADVLLLELKSGAWHLARVVAPLDLPMFMTLDGKALELDSELRVAFLVTFPLMTFDPAVVERLSAQVHDAMRVMNDPTLDIMDKFDAATLLVMAGQGVMSVEDEAAQTWSWRDGHGQLSAGAYLTHAEALIGLAEHLSK